MKQLFKVKIEAQSTVHTVDPHIANYYLQCEKLLNLIESDRMNNNNSGDKEAITLEESKTNENKSNGSNEITIVLNDTNKEIINNSVKVSNFN